MDPIESAKNAGAEPATMIGGARTKPGNHVDLQKKGAPEYVILLGSLVLDQSPFSWVTKRQQMLLL